MSPEPWWQDEGVTLYLGDCLEVLPSLPECSIDAIVTDPPAGISFMGRDWDSGRGGRDRWVAWLAERMEAAARCLKPGGHLLVWSLPRTSHWTALALEEAGLEIRDCILHLFGSGFPKSHDVSKAIDRAAGAEREVVGLRTGRSASPQHDMRGGRLIGGQSGAHDGAAITAPATEDAARWEGWGTALKPGQEMWWLARKPLAEGTVAANVLAHGTGALNISGCRVEGAARRAIENGIPLNPGTEYGGTVLEGTERGTLGTSRSAGLTSQGRWPPNVLLTHSASCAMTGILRVRGGSRADRARDGANGIPSTVLAGGADGTLNAVQSPGYADADGMETVEAWACADDCPAAELDRQGGVLSSGANPERRSSDKFRDTYGEFAGQRECMPARGADKGGASRFFPAFRYEAKAPASERPRLDDGTAHPTVKPLGLISWLVRLITPPGGTVLDLFAGSGPVAEACTIEGFRCILIEQAPSSAELIKARLSKPIQPALFGLDAG